MRITPFFIAPLVLAAAGCATSPLDNVGSAPFNSPNQLMALPAQPHVEAYPVALTPQRPPKAVRTAEEPLPIWENTQIQKVLVDAYIDDKGNLHPESYMYVVVKEGGWNLDAVRRPENYIPPENAVKPMNGYGVSYALGSALPSGATPQSNSLAIAGAENVRITGMLRKEDGEKARQLAGDNEIAVYDPKLGWVIAPKSALTTAIEAPNAYKIPPSGEKHSERPPKAPALHAVPQNGNEAKRAEQSPLKNIFDEF